MSEFSDLRDEFKTEFVDTGFWIPLRLTSQDSPPIVTDAHAGYRAPDNLRVNGSISSDCEIQYVAGDLPELAEGDQVDLLDADGNPISGQAFRVRESPYVTDDPASDQSGYFMRALLTKL